MDLSIHSPCSMCIYGNTNSTCMVCMQRSSWFHKDNEGRRNLRRESEKVRCLTQFSVSTEK